MSNSKDIKVTDHLQILLLILSKFNRINYVLLPQKTKDILMISSRINVIKLT